MVHPDPDVLLRFLFCTASRAENRQVVRHLLARCPSCAATMRQFLYDPPPQDPVAYDLAFDRAASFLRSLLRKTSPPCPPEAGDGEDDLPRSSLTSGSAARRRFVFG